MENELTVYESQPLTAKDIQSQVNLIQEVMQKVMIKGEHFGVIPGCGDKPALLKPGAEKLNLTFRMAPDFEIETIDMGKGHREYRVKCSLKSISTGKFLGMGVGSASTMEAKWRFRNAEPEITDRIVPKEYWDLKKKDANKAQEMIGGKGFITKKIDGVWKIAKLTGEKMEHENPADYYNTCLKTAKKRAHVDAVLIVTAASDIFTQDIEEMVENGGIDVTPEKPTERSTEPPTEPPPPNAPSPDWWFEPSTEKQHTTIYTIGKKLGLTEDGIKDRCFKIVGHPVDSIKTLTRGECGKVIEELQKEKK